MFLHTHTGKQDSGMTAKPVKSAGFSKAGLVIVALCVLTELAFGYFVIASGLIPLKYAALIILLLLGLAVVIGILTYKTDRKLAFVLGACMAVALIAVLIYGITALWKISATLDAITTTTTETAEVALYVLDQDEAESLTDLINDTFGIISELDRTNTDLAVAQINQTLSTTITTAEYDSITELVDALLAGEVRAIVVNVAYVDLLEDLDDYADVPNQLREISMFSVVTQIEMSVDSRADGAEAAVETDIDIEQSAFILYISGSDSRTGLSSKARSDVNIIAVVNTDTRQILLISTPRDFYVPLSISNGVKDKLTHAGIYGVQVSMDTLAMLYDVEIDYYFKICFQGVVGIVDALGGVSVYSEYAFTSSHSGYTFTVGYNDVTGDMALDFVRERYAFATGDRQRGKNQMALIRAVVKKACSPSILTGYSSILDSVSANFETNISAESITALVSRQLAFEEEWNIVTYSVNGSDGRGKTYSAPNYNAYVMIPDESTVATAKELIAAVMAGEVIEQP